METVVVISTVAGMILSLIAILGVMWRIATSVKSTQIAIATIQKDLCEIKIIIDRTDTRVDKLNDDSIGHEKDIKAAHRRIDEIRDNCMEHRKARLG